MKRRAAAALLSLALASCENAGDPRICGSLAMQFPAGMMPKTSDDQMQVAFSCVERWAARLARGPDPAVIVARAAVFTCANAIAYLVEMGRKDRIVERADYADLSWWRDHALFIVVQTRAGDCYPDA